MCSGFLYSQSPQCDGCPSVPYSNPIFITVHRFCPLEIKYITRFCNGAFELKILQVRRLIDSCSGFAPSEIFHTAIASLLLDNPMNFPPGYWNILNAPCWKFDLIEPKIMIPCNDTHCCILSVYTRLSNCNKAEVSNFSEQGFSYCPSGGPQFIDCNYVCDPFLPKLIEIITKLKTD